MNGGAKTCWRTVAAQPLAGDASVAVVDGAPPDKAGLCPIPRGRWLAALYRLQNGEPIDGLQLVDPARAVPLTDPADVDWTGFPVLEALEATARDELRMLRSLLDEPPHPLASPPPPRREDAFTPPGGLVWGLDLRRTTASEL
jgi:hypothetical protein